MEQAELAKINALTRREFAENEIYTFPVTLCHNDIDRDSERFSDEALTQMSELFIGKTIITDHNPTTAGQVARIYDTEVVKDSGQLTKDGRPFCYLKGYAYMVRTSENADFILEIDAGIKKEVSVSCSAEKRICSICGAEAGKCSHVKGETYDDTVCCHILDSITDAYELSFVAVPAQQGAGVTKNYHQKGDTHMEEFIPITTKADFDTAVQPLIDAAVSAKAKEFENWISPEAHQAELLAQYRTKAALLTGLPAELASRLTGDTEEAIQKDAELLAGLTKSSRQTPAFNPETPELSGVEKSFYAKNPNLAPNRKENA